MPRQLALTEAMHPTDQEPRRRRKKEKRCACQGCSNEIEDSKHKFCSNGCCTLAGQEALSSGYPIIVSLSGGKDSTAMLLWLLEHYDPQQILVHHQLLPESWPQTLAYNQHLCQRLGVRLVCQQIIYQPVGEGTGTEMLEVRDIKTRADVVPFGTPGVISGVTDLAYRRGKSPSPSIRLGTAYSKVRLLNHWISTNRADLGDQIIVALGERALESPRRAKKKPWELRLKRESYNVFNWHPILTWPRKQTFAKLQDHSIDPHPAYFLQGMTQKEITLDREGGPRLGCRFCIFCRHTEALAQAQLPENLPLLQHIAQFEQENNWTWWPRRSGAPVQRSATQLLKMLESGVSLPMAGKQPAGQLALF